MREDIARLSSFRRPNPRKRLMALGRWEQTFERFQKSPTRIPITIFASLSEWPIKRQMVFGPISSIMLPIDWPTTEQPGPRSGIKLNKKSPDLLHRSVLAGRLPGAGLFCKSRNPVSRVSVLVLNELPCGCGERIG